MDATGYLNSYQLIARKSLLVNGLGWFGPGSFVDARRVKTSSAAWP